MSSNNRLFAVGGLFDDSNTFLKAVEAIRDKGYLKYDANTPCPIHGLDDAMGLEKTSIGRVAFIFGFIGLFAIVAFMIWTSVWDYPLVIGGKPLNSLPAFIPIAFEATVFMAAVVTVIVLITVYLKLPYNAHPIHDSEYIKNTSCNKMGIYVEAADDKFEANEIRAEFKKLGAISIEDIFFTEEEESFKAPLFDVKFVSGLAALFIMVGGLTWLTLQYGLNILPFNWMSEQPRYSAQSTSEFFGGRSAMLVPVAGTVPRGYMPYAYHNKPEEAGLNLINPLMTTKEVLARGEQQYDIFCSVCHGDLAQGDGRMIDKFPAAPSLHSKKVRDEWTDGRIYHVITDGQNIMPSYSKQIPSDDRWAIIQYLRVLQRSQNAKESDLK